MQAIVNTCSTIGNSNRNETSAYKTTSRSWSHPAAALGRLRVYWTLLQASLTEGHFSMCTLSQVRFIYQLTVYCTVSYRLQRQRSSCRTVCMNKEVQKATVKRRTLISCEETLIPFYWPHSAVPMEPYTGNLADEVRFPLSLFQSTGFLCIHLKDFLFHSFAKSRY